MAIDFSQMMLNPSPIVKLGGLGGGGGGMERERLRLMREQFEQSKKEHDEQKALRELEEDGRNARTRLQGEQEKAAKTQADRMAAYKTFTELNGSGDIEGARAMVPMMSALGMGVDLEGEENGLPRYRIEIDGKAAEQQESARTAQASPYGQNESAVQSLDRMGALGYPTNDSGGMNEPAGIPSTEDAFGQAQAASQYAEETGGPARGPDEQDYTGGVPNNVLDMGAIQAQSLRRLDPALGGLIAGLPEEYQDSARSTAQGVRGLGLPATKAVELYGKQQGDANALITGRLNAGEKEGDNALQMSKEQFDRYKAGFDTLGKEVAAKYGIESRLRARGLNDQAMKILTNSTKEDDYLVLSLISRSFGERGATTEGDVARALGLPATSTWDQITGWLSSRLDGGIPEPNKKALIGVLKSAVDSNDTEIGTFSDRLLELANDPETDPDVAKGVRDYWRATVPKSMREQREAERKGASSGNGGDVITGEVVIPESSRIAKVHNNPGNLKFADQSGATKGEAADDGGAWAQFETPEAGLAALRSQIEKDAGRGQTIREFVTKYAPPGSNDTEKYIEQAATALRATADDLLSDVDVYDVLRFVAKKESGTELPDQYDEPAAEAMADQNAAEAPMGPPAPPAEGDARKKRLAELRAKYGR